MKSQFQPWQLLPLIPAGWINLPQEFADLPSLREARSVIPVARCCDLAIPVPQSRCSRTAVATVPELCCRHILPAHTDSRASPPGVRLDFAFTDSARREGQARGLQGPVDRDFGEAQALT